jgi:hypothetical protein
MAAIAWLGCLARSVCRRIAWRVTLAMALLAPVVPGAMAQVPATNYQGLWWAAPAGSQPGWGINVAHQGDVIFATWFTYMTRFHLPQWISMTATKTADGEYTGNLVMTSGSPYSTVPYNNGDFGFLPFVGSATLKFGSPTTGTLIYTPATTEIRQPITLMAFGPLPTCVWGATPDLSKATNYTDLWWASPPGSEAGWGVNLTHQGNVIFATWFTYDFDNAPDWMSVTANQVSPNTYAGTLYRTTGPNWGVVPFQPSEVTYLEVGAAVLQFQDGNNAVFTTTVNVYGGAGNTTQVKNITRQVFRPPGTVCH